MSQTRRYPAKILLFGEYTVLNGAQAFAIPFTGKWGQWETVNNIPLTYSKHYQQYLKWLQEKEIEHEKVVQLDLDKMQADFDNGFIFQSNIPYGYGLGSSGAFCAAIYDRYATNKANSEDNITLRNQLAELESFFHGKSSGVDPFVSLIERPVLRERSDQFRILNPMHFPADWTILLVDSGFPRSTSQCVATYRSKMLNPAYKNQIFRSLVPHVEHAIQFLMSQSWELVWSQLQNISRIQADLFSEMIPGSIETLWNACLRSDNSRMKLCGAGGGGYFLIFSVDKDRTTHLLNGWNYLVVQ